MTTEEFYTYVNHAPHWRQARAAYLVNWRLLSETPDLNPAERTIVAETLTKFHRERYLLFAWVVMNDHVHALVKPLPGFELAQIVHSWKSYTANRLQRLFGRKGSVWQKDYFDRIIVSWKEFM